MMDFASALPILRLRSIIVTHLMSGRAIVGTAQSSAKLAIDVLQDDHIGVDIMVRDARFDGLLTMRV